MGKHPRNKKERQDIKKQKLFKHLIYFNNAYYEGKVLESYCRYCSDVYYKDFRTENPYWKKIYQPKRLKYYRIQANRSIRRHKLYVFSKGCNYKKFTEVWYMVH